MKTIQKIIDRKIGELNKRIQSKSIKFVHGKIDRNEVFEFGHNFPEFFGIQNVPIFFEKDLTNYGELSRYVSRRNGHSTALARIMIKQDCIIVCKNIAAKNELVKLCYRIISQEAKPETLSEMIQFKIEFVIDKIKYKLS